MKKFIPHLLIFLSVELLILQKIISSNTNLGFIIFITASIITSLLIFLALEDLQRMDIPAYPTYALLVLLIIFNLGLILLDIKSITLWDHTTFIPMNNLLGGLAGSAFIILLIIITRGKGIGSGDVYLAAIMGLILGTDKLVIGFYSTLLIACLTILMYSLRIRKIKDVKVPLVPFIVFGIIFTLIFYTQIKDFLTVVYL